MKHTYTVLDYLSNEHSSFEEKPFCLLDAFVLGISSYLLFERVTRPEHTSPAPQHEHFATQLAFEEPILVANILKEAPTNALCDLFWFDSIAPQFSAALSKSRRFAALEVSDVATALDQTNFTQFAAQCFHVPDGSFYLSFRGTDNTITGWEEDFTLAILDPIPSQSFALEYTYAMMDKWLHAQSLISKMPRHARIPKLRVGGHSKGGNLAFYAAAHCKQPYQQAITHAYSFDGPGVNPWGKDTVKLETLQPRLTKIVPSQSVFGRIFDDITPAQVVASNEFALMQHMPFSWEIKEDEGSYSFVTREAPSLFSDSTNSGLSHWIASLGIEERIEFCSGLFGLVEYVAGDNNIESFQKNLLSKVPEIAVFLASLDKESRQFVFSVISSLAGNLTDSLKERLFAQFRK